MASTTCGEESFVNVCEKDIKVQGRLVRIARLGAEGLEFLENPEAALVHLRESGVG